MTIICHAEKSDRQTGGSSEKMQEKTELRQADVGRRVIFKHDKEREGTDAEKMENISIQRRPGKG